MSCVGIVGPLVLLAAIRWAAILVRDRAAFPPWVLPERQAERGRRGSLNADLLPGPAGSRVSGSLRDTKGPVSAMLAQRGAP